MPSRPDLAPASAVALFLALGTAPVLAQGAATTGTGGGPVSTITAPHTTANGTTKPPGAAGAPEPGNARTGQEKRDDKIMQGICIGCGVK